MDLLGLEKCLAGIWFCCKNNMCIFKRIETIALSAWSVSKAESVVARYFSYEISFEQMSNHSCSNYFTCSNCFFDGNPFFWFFFWGPPTDESIIVLLQFLEFWSPIPRIPPTAGRSCNADQLQQTIFFKWKMVILGGWLCVEPTPFFLGGGSWHTNWVSPCSNLFIFCWILVLDQSVHEPS